jgi:deazaflavin-dependent oxidoreductase (nitroreductase family)
MRRTRVVSVLIGLGCLAFIMRNRGVGSVVRRFNKHVLNPFALWLATRRTTYYGVMHHAGRHSGHVYATPVVAKLTPNGVIIPLPYGADTDWCRNVLAAQAGTLSLNGTEYPLAQPEIVDADVAGRLVPAATARVWRWMGIRKYLHMNARADVISRPAEAA